MNRRNFWQSKLSSVIIILVISLSVLAISQKFTKPSGSTSKLTTPVKMDAIDSSSCIACHTDAATILSMAVVEEDTSHSAEGG